MQCKLNVLNSKPKEIRQCKQFHEADEIKSRTLKSRTDLKYWQVRSGKDPHCDLLDHQGS